MCAELDATGTRQPELTARRQHHDDAPALLGEQGDRAAGEDGFVIGVGVEHDHGAARHTEIIARADRDVSAGGPGLFAEARCW